MYWFIFYSHMMLTKWDRDKVEVLVRVDNNKSIYWFWINPLVHKSKLISYTLAQLILVLIFWLKVSILSSSCVFVFFYCYPWFRVAESRCVGKLLTSIILLIASINTATRLKNINNTFIYMFVFIYLIIYFYLNAIAVTSFISIDIAWRWQQRCLIYTMMMTLLTRMSWQWRCKLTWFSH